MCGGVRKKMRVEKEKNPQNGKEKITLSFNGAPLGERERKKKRKKQEGGGRMWENIAAQAKKTNIK